MSKLKLKGVKETFGIAGASVGMGVIGEAINSEGLVKGGEVAGKFIPIAVNVGMGATVINMLKELKNEKEWL